MDIVSIKDQSLFDSLWLHLWQQDHFHHPFYLKWNIEWSKEVAEAKGAKFENVSFVIVEDNTPILGILGTVQEGPEDMHEIGYYGRPFFYLESKNTGYPQLKQAYKLLSSELEQVINEYSIKDIFYQDLLKDNKLSYPGWFLMELGATAMPYFTQIIDLSLTEEQLHSQIRKSYSSLINWGLKNLDISIYDSKTVTKEIIEEFRQLHADVAGRYTRTARSWEIQHEMVKNNEAFIVTGRCNSVLVTTAFFIYSLKWCNYGASASKRDMFDKPLAHSILWNGILYAKRLGCLYFETGEQLYPNQKQPSPTDKELGIVKFKRGFGGETFVRLDIRLSIQAGRPAGFKP
jgi:FemAB family protein